MNKRSKLTLLFLILVFLSTGSYVYWQTRTSHDLVNDTSQTGSGAPNHNSDKLPTKSNPDDVTSDNTRRGNSTTSRKELNSDTDHTWQNHGASLSTNSANQVFMAGSPIAILSSSKILGKPPYDAAESKALQEAVEIVSKRLNLQVVIDCDSESEINFTRVIWSRESLDITSQVADEMQKIATQ